MKNPFGTKKRRELSTDVEIERAWLEVSERRWQEIQTGRIQTIPADQVMREARAALKKCP